VLQAARLAVSIRPLAALAQGEEPDEPRGTARGGRRLGPAAMTSVHDPRGAHFEIKIDGIVRTHRDFRETAIEAARFLQMFNPNAKIAVTDQRDGSAVPFDRQDPAR